ncbi:MAG: glycosyltransferase family 9 protein [Steroidobacterales bacterium]
MSLQYKVSLTERSAVERLLVVRCGAFGDMVLLTALIRELHSLWQCPIDIVTSGPWSEPLLRGQSGVGAIYTVRSRKTPYWFAPDQWRLVRALRAHPAVPTWFCDGGDAGKALLHRAGIRAQDMVDVNDHPLRPGEHATEQWRRLAQIRPQAWADFAWPGAAAGESGCHLEVSAAQLADLSAWLSARSLAGRPLILVQVGNKRTMRRGPRRLAANHKYWPLERWAEVIGHVRRTCPEHLILLLGTGPEHELNQELAALAGLPPAQNVADDLPVPRLVALMSRAAALISVDSGPAHVAAAVGCPQVVLFGKASPALYRPWGAGDAQVEVLTGEVDGAASMLGIEARTVVSAWDRLALRR